MFIKFNSKYHQRMYALKIVRFNEQNHDESDPALTFRELYPQITLPNCNVNEKKNDKYLYKVERENTIILIEYDYNYVFPINWWIVIIAG